MIRHTNLEMTAMNEEVSLPFPRNKSHGTPCREPHGEAAVNQDAEKARGNVGSSLYRGFCGKE